ncbi:LTA synthase family protein [Algoriphagus sp.]|uniref:LTA synthase family protein n=1 Tax=Algoriphagus sp. TaxID=1872435 RepID=UPI002603EB50|nr:LTA synthase family protein [Algoriphagus sp.]
MAQKAAIRSTLPYRLRVIFKNFWGVVLMFIVLMILLRGLELFLVFENHVLDFSISDIFLFSLRQDIGWLFYLTGLLLMVYLPISFLSAKIGKVLVLIILTFLTIVQVGLVFYFMKTLVPLGKDLFAYSIDDLLLTISSSGQLNFWTISGGGLGLAAVVILLNLGAKFFSLSLKGYLVLTLSFLVLILAFTLYPQEQIAGANENKVNITLNKSRFLTEQAFEELVYGGEYYFDFYLRSTSDDLLISKEYLGDEYPFAHKANYPDVLTPFFDTLPQAPDIVFIFLESFGRAYSGKEAYLGSFSPFLDSLEQHSLVWLNAISSTGRTFGLQPGVFGGLPFGSKGFLELSDEYPYHQTLLSILGDNGYQIRYFIGADKNFDQVGSFVEYQKPDQFIDERGFDSRFKKGPSSSEFSWGYADLELFTNGLEKLPPAYSAPQVITFQTQTSHDPYLVPEREYYSQKFESHLENYLNLAEEEKPDYRAYQDIYMTVLYADDAVKFFIEEYKKRPEFEHTIFIITGDHRLPEIPMSTRLDRFHVPLIIYSPLLKRPDYFKAMTSHYEITPSILAFLEKQNFVELPEIVTWQGQVFDTTRNFQSRIAMPLMRNKNQLVEYIHGEFFLSDGELFVINEGLDIEPIQSPDMLTKLTGEFEDFKNRNTYMVQTRKLLPPKEKN